MIRGLFRRRLPERLAVVIDELAEAFVSDPVRMTLLLGGHAGAVFALDAAVIDPHTPAHEIAMARSEADLTRAAVLHLSHAAQHLTDRNTQETDR